MRRIIYAMMLASMLVSCGQKEKGDLERRREQVRSEKEKAARQEEERIANHKSDSLAALAWGDAVWGMTKDEVLHTLAFRNGKSYDYTIDMDFDRVIKTREAFGLNHLYAIRANMLNNSLCGIYLSSHRLKTEQFDELSKECIFLKNNFYRLYGKPTKNNKMSFSGFDKDGKQIVAEYHTGHRLGKTITITLNKDGYEYWYETSILPLITSRDNKTLSFWLNKFDKESERSDDVEIFSF